MEYRKMFREFLFTATDGPINDSFVSGAILVHKEENKLKHDIKVAVKVYQGSNQPPTMIPFMGSEDDLPLMEKSIGAMADVLSGLRDEIRALSEKLRSEPKPPLHTVP